MKKFLPYLLLLTIGIFAFNLIADRLTPYTDNARIKAVVIPVVPQVSGYISNVVARNYDSIPKGSTIFQIDTAPYEIALQTAQAELETALQAQSVNAAEIAIAQSNVVQAQASYSNTKLQLQRLVELNNSGLSTQSEVDDKRSELEQSKQRLESAKSLLIKSNRAFGSNGADNPSIKLALAKLERAKLELEWTNVKAPSNGALVDLRVSEGNFAKANEPVMTFISKEELWIDAYFTENNLGHLTIGDSVDIALDSHPGKVFSGKVTSLNIGASSQIFNISSKNNVGLPPIPRRIGWMRDPQRFPVRIAFNEHENKSFKSDILLRFNGQADIIVYTKKSNRLFNTFAQAWISALSYLSYAY